MSLQAGMRKFPVMICRDCCVIRVGGMVMVIIDGL